VLVLRGGVAYDPSGGIFTVYRKDEFIHWITEIEKLQVWL